MSDFTLKVGGVEIVALSDMNLPFPMPLTQLFPTAPAEAWEPYKQLYPDAFQQDHMLIEIGCYLVRSEGQTILIDTGYGEGPIEAIGGRKGELMDDLAAKGISPAEVNTVFLSHLHSDHVGWNVVERDGRLEAAFPNARYVAHQADLDHFRRPDIQAASTFPFMDRCMESIAGMGLLDTLTADTDLTGEVRALHTPGHTPGHMSILGIVPGAGGADPGRRAGASRPGDRGRLELPLRPRLARVHRHAPQDAGRRGSQGDGGGVVPLPRAGLRHGRAA